MGCTVLSGGLAALGIVGGLVYAAIGTKRNIDIDRKYSEKDDSHNCADGDSDHTLSDSQHYSDSGKGEHMTDVRFSLPYNPAVTSFPYTIPGGSESYNPGNTKIVKIHPELSPDAFSRSELAEVAKDALNNALRSSMQLLALRPDRNEAEFGLDVSEGRIFGKTYRARGKVKLR